tara:strand:+ start:2303 stop:2542 length:240 start_codon:yes stop_codon:yes gene_type:complete
MKHVEERYEDCDRCGERYHGEDIGRWLRDEKRTPSKHFDETWRVCCKEEERYGHAQLTGQELYDHENPAPLENPMDWEK